MKFTHHDLIKNQLSQLVIKGFKEAFDYDLDKEVAYSTFSAPPSFDVAHYCFPTFRWAKELKSNPAQLGQKLAEAIDFPQGELKAQGPYINFKFSADALHSQILPYANDKTLFDRELTRESLKTLVEYSQPNTHKELHVGHMRNIALGASLINLNKYFGVDITSCTYPGDMGTHVAKCLWYMKYHNNESAPAENKGAWLGKLYSKASIKLEDEKGTDQEEKNREQLKEILNELLSESGPMYDLWKETRQWSIDGMKEIYNWVGIDFDHWYWESVVDAPSLKLVKEYQEKGLFIEDDGAVGIDLSDHKLGFCILLKRDGHGLYATKDLELARQKFNELNIEKNIYIVDSRQALHFKQVFKTLELMGFENADKCEHLAYEFVELPDGPISSRNGNLIPLRDLIDQMQSHIVTNYLSKHESWSIEKKEKIAHQVAIGAINYGMLSTDSNKKIVFVMEDWLKLDGESGPYIQYTHARIQSVLSKGAITDRSADYYLELLTEPKEMELAMMINQFNSMLENVVAQNKVSSLCTYMYQMAKSFNSYYANNSIANNEDPRLNKARIFLANAVAKTLETGLSLLNIPAPDEM